MIGRWDTWIYMPWRYQWSIGTGDKGGEFCREFGINGGFTDHGEGPLQWLDKWRLRFYHDHTAAKGYLYLHRDNNGRRLPVQRDPRALRSGPDGPCLIDDAMLEDFAPSSPATSDGSSRVRCAWPMRWTTKYPGARSSLRSLGD